MTKDDGCRGIRHPSVIRTGAGQAEICAYGTAVVVEPLAPVAQPPQPPQA